VLTGIVAAPPCAVCGSASARIELVAPGGNPAGWDNWSQQRKDRWQGRRDPGEWYLLFEGVAAGNGSGGPISADWARRIAAGFAEPLGWAQVHMAGFYDDAGFCRALPGVRRPVLLPPLARDPLWLRLLSRGPRQEP
jgi:hypothetical protein